MNLLVDEALRTNQHPGIMLRSVPTGRRAALAAGPDVWEVVRDVRSARAAEPGLGEGDLLGMLAENTGVGAAQIRVAVRYLAAYPQEIDAEIDAADAAENAAHDSWLREQRLLAG